MQPPKTLLQQFKLCSFGALDLTGINFQKNWPVTQEQEVVVVVVVAVVAVVCLHVQKIFVVLCSI